MAESNLTQEEADSLIAMEKIRVSDDEYLFPSPGDKLTISLTSFDKREAFLLDIGRGRFESC